MASLQGCRYWIIDHVVNDVTWFGLRLTDHLVFLF